MTAVTRYRVTEFSESVEAPDFYFAPAALPKPLCGSHNFLDFEKIE